MARDLGDIPDARGRRRKAWVTPNRLAGAGIFIVGLLIGMYVGIQFLQPVAVKNLTEDLNNMQKVNTGLDQRLDGLLNCLSARNIDPETCEGMGGN